MSNQTFETKKTGVISMPRLLLHLEGLVLLAGALFVYASRDYSWLTFILLFMLPDLPLLLYPAAPRAASIAYNLVHTLALPVALGLFSFFGGSAIGMQAALQAALVWLAHIGMDHTFGYGLKYLGSMKETHFSRV